MSPYALIITDVQHGLSGADDPLLLRAIAREIEIAKQNGLPIIVIEFPDPQTLRMIRAGAEASGKPYPFSRVETQNVQTLPAIMALLKGYDKVTVRTKYDFSGASEVIWACGTNGWSKAAFRVVGVYAFSCVMATAHELLETTNARVEVVQDACATKGKDYWFRFYEEIILVPGAGQ